MSAHAFWGLLGKAGKLASSGVKSTATVGKGAAAGAVGAEGAAEVATRGAAATAGLGDDAARTGLRFGAAESSAVNAALPPELAAYLSRPAKDLTARDTAAMMSSYEQMAARAGRTGDFTVFERAPNVAADRAPRATPRPPTGGSATPSVLPLEAVRLLAHAANAGHRGAQQELARVCTPGAPAANQLTAETRFSPAFIALCASRPRAP